MATPVNFLGLLERLFALAIWWMHVRAVDRDELLAVRDRAGATEKATVGNGLYACLLHGSKQIREQALTIEEDSSPDESGLGRGMLRCQFETVHLHDEALWYHTISPLVNSALASNLPIKISAWDYSKLYDIIQHWNEV
ncbi:hypothetical protein ACHAQJ_006628 [Trichoderma viride]